MWQLITAAGWNVGGALVVNDACMEGRLSGPPVVKAECWDGWRELLSSWCGSNDRAENDAWCWEQGQQRALNFSSISFRKVFSLTMGDWQALCSAPIC